MNATTRKNEIIKAMPSFSKDCYSKSDLLAEMFKLQTEMVRVTFNDEHAENANLKIWDVYNYLNKLNTERAHVADDLLHHFEDGCKNVSNFIQGEISGNKGEKEALWNLKAVHTYRKFLQNIELCSDDHRTELDIIVLTKKAIFIVEVKNTRQTIVIDEKGNYSRVKDGQAVHDKNIGEQMNSKVILLREVLESAGIVNPNIVSLVVFTNTKANVTNNYPYIQHCFKCELPHIIDRYHGDDLYDTDTIKNMERYITEAKTIGMYEPSLNIGQFKQIFADLVVALESFQAVPQEENPSPIKVTANKMDKRILHRKRMGAALTLLPLGGMVILTTLGLKQLPQR